jgi:HK97 family phage major capsid protein
MNNLIERRSAALKENQAIAGRVQAEGRPFDADETRKVAENFALAKDLESTIEQARKIEESVAPVAAAAPLLADGGERKSLRSLRGIDGREHNIFTRADKLADHVNHVQDGLSIRDLGNALAAMACGEGHRYREEVRALSEGLNTGGGLMISEELSAQIYDQLRAKSVCFEAGAVMIPMVSDTLRLVRIDSDPSVALTAEGASIVESDGSFDSILLVAKKLACLTSATNELLADAANAGDVIVQSITAAMAREVDDYILGKLFASSQIGTEASVGAIGYADLLKARYDVRALNGNPATLICNPSLPYDLSLITEATTGAFMLPPAQLADLQILDTTAITDDHAILGDFSQAVVGWRKNVELRISSEAGTALSRDVSYFRAIARLDANVLQPAFRILAGIS